MNVIKYKKIHKQQLISTINKNLSLLKYGIYGLKTITSGFLFPNQVEAARRVISRETKRVGKIFIRIRFNFPITKKPLLSRMGKGIGPIKQWIAKIKKGVIILELIGLVKEISIKALQASLLRLPLKIIIIWRGFLIKIA